MDTNMINDAVIHGELSDDVLDAEIELAISPMGQSTKPGKWRNWKTTVRDFLTRLSVHEIGSKDGNSMLAGAVVNGERKAAAIPHLDLLILDLDTGESLSALRARIQELNLFALIYSTHSNGRDITEVKKDTVVKHMEGSGEPTAEDVCAYLLDIKRYQPHILKNATILKTEHTERGIEIFLQHQPMPKFRVVLLLAKRFIIAQRGGTQAEALAEWRERYFGVSKMLNAFCDRSTTDVSRLFFLPRHPKGATDFTIEVIAGEMLDLNKVERVTLEELKKENMSAIERAAAEIDAEEYATSSLKFFFAKYGDRFEIDDFYLEMDPDGDRGPRSSGPGRTHRCPNDDQHSNAGDESDKGHYCVNASESDTEKAISHCRHDSCSMLDRINFTDLICQKVGISDGLDLKKWVPETEEDDEPEEKIDADEPAELKPFQNVAEAKRFVGNLPEGEHDPAIEAAVRIGKSGFSSAVVDGIVKQLAKRSGLGMRALNGEVKRGAQEAAKDKGAAKEFDEDTLVRMAKWNKQFAVVKLPNKIKIVLLPQTPLSDISFLDTDSFRLLTANQKVVNFDQDGKPIITPMSKEWMEWSDRNEYLEGVCFEPGGAPKGAYNLWRGFPVKPRAGDWSLLQEHIKENVCLGDNAHYEWFMTWLAQLFQQPGIKLGSAVAIQGKKGTGKSKVFDWVREALGAHGLKVSHRGHITGNFNSHQSDIILMVCEEAFWAADQQAGGILKDLITSPQMVLEKKGLDAIKVSNYCRLVMVSNERWIVPAGLDDERRFFVLHCGDKRRQDSDFFASMDQQMHSGGLEAMVHTLMSWRPPGGDWNILRKPPKTPWLQQQAMETMTIGDRFFLQLAERGKYAFDVGDDTFEIEIDKEGPNYVPVELMQKCFEHYVGRSNQGRHMIGNSALLNDLVRRHLLAEPVYVQTGGRLCHSVPGLPAVQDHLRSKGVPFEAVEER